MLNVLMIANIALSFSAFFLAVSHSNLAPWAIGAATVSAVVVFMAYKSPIKPARALPRSDVSGVPSPDEITATLERVRAFLKDERGTAAELQPQPPTEITVDCLACQVQEVYPVGTGNAAAQSAHLLTHPERCLVIGA